MMLVGVGVGIQHPLMQVRLHSGAQHTEPLLNVLGWILFNTTNTMTQGFPTAPHTLYPDSQISTRELCQMSLSQALHTQGAWLCLRGHGQVILAESVEGEETEERTKPVCSWAITVAVRG